MNLNEAVKKLSENVIGKVKINEKMSKHTTWHIGGPADIFFSPANVDDLKEAITFVKTYNLPLTVLGGGSNILVSDSGIRGLVIKLNELNDLEIKNDTVRVGAGISLPFISYRVAQLGLSGLEFASGIPGSLGGAIRMNAGAHGEQIADVIEKVTVIDQDGKISSLSKEELDFSYRFSKLKNMSVIVIEAELKLKKGDSEKIKEKILSYKDFRRSKQPINYPNAGSVFKNPLGDSAGRLIESIGAKGWKVGKAMVSLKHANFIVNLGDAKCEDVLCLMRKINKKIKEEYDLELEPEIIFLGG